jgi:hypothetical protein
VLLNNIFTNMPERDEMLNRKAFRLMRLGAIKAACAARRSGNEDSSPWQVNLGNNPPAKEKPKSPIN